jgi:diadenosine tetraphosphate (Ap4A) HIT family hydrolase
MTPMCDVCRIHEDSVARQELEIVRDDRWVVRHHAQPSPLVGWTFLCTHRHVQGMADLNDLEAAEFGHRMRETCAAVRQITGCDRVYAVAFGQGAPHLHVHLIPRFDADPQTRAWEVADHYRAVERGERPAADPGRVRQFVAHMRQELLP